MSVKAKNPIMPGFYPDPSICVAGEDFYLINSTFAYYPRLPIMHSRDLAHWEQIGNAMYRKEQVPLENAGHSGGLFAPTMRYHDGVYYVICTNISYGGNFIVTATNPKGPWSVPHYLKGADGIDPSLFFDDDGKCYYIGTHSNPEGCKYDGDNYLWIQEIDLGNMELVGEVHNVWKGALINVVWPEGPHLYKKDGYYYIMNAEGGTGPNHAVTICRSKNIFGPYENNPRNPILTHRHLGQNYPVKCVGHADMFETVNGEWYMVMLAVRPIEGYTILGRETFLAHVEWEDGWPVVNPGVGKLTDDVEINLPEWKPDKSASGKDTVYDFGDMSEIGSEFLMLRNPDDDMYVLERGKGLGLKYGKTTLKEKKSPSYVALRQRHHHFSAKAILSIDSLTANNKAGMALVQSNEYNFRVEISRKDKDSLDAQIIMCSQGIDNIICTNVIEKIADITQIEVILKVDGLSVSVGVRTFDYGMSLAGGIDIRQLSTEVAGGFVGCTVGMYAVSTDGSDDIAVGESDRAYFKRFTYSNEEEFS